ncbi:MAG: AAA family ATPase [Verrucomicrobia bacterium]|nr:AAA family ATPase [Verrucomicrobiota bacterium]
MLTTLAVENYRSLRNLVVPLGRLNVIKGVNGSGKSNLYKSLRLLADTASGCIVSSLAREGGLPSTFWAGPEKITAWSNSRPEALGCSCFLVEYLFAWFPIACDPGKERCW